MTNQRNITTKKYNNYIKTKQINEQNSYENKIQNVAVTEKASLFKRFTANSLAFSVPFSLNIYILSDAVQK